MREVREQVISQVQVVVNGSPIRDFSIDDFLQKFFLLSLFIALMCVCVWVCVCVQQGKEELREATALLLSQQTSLEVIVNMCCSDGEASVCLEVCTRLNLKMPGGYCSQKRRGALELNW